jgi:hypothetical protein
VSDFAADIRRNDTRSFQFPVGSTEFADQKKCTVRKPESALVPQSVSEHYGHSQSGDNATWP